MLAPANGTFPFSEVDEPSPSPGVGPIRYFLGKILNVETRSR
ncbi:hypothetical protein [Synechococcus sp. PCC 6312]|nr:hypothetical protein [Synechococcus sp. PCC 6312]